MFGFAFLMFLSPPLIVIINVGNTVGGIGPKPYISFHWKKKLEIMKENFIDKSDKSY